MDIAVIVSIQAGVDRFPFDKVCKHGVLLTNSSGIHGPAVGETVAGYMLSFARRLLPAVKSQTQREWSPPAWDAAYTLADERCCIVGLGTLSRGIVERASALGLNVVGVRRSGDSLDGVRTVYTPDDLHTAIRDSKFVVLAVPLVDEIRHLMSTEEFAAMRDDAILINVARGPVVDQEAVVDALEAGELGGAALDVFEAEPLPEESPLWEFVEVLITPHCAGFTEDYYRNVADLVRENLAYIDAGDDCYAQCCQRDYGMDYEITWLVRYDSSFDEWVYATVTMGETYRGSEGETAYRQVQSVLRNDAPITPMPMTDYPIEIDLEVSDVIGQ